MLLLGGWGVSIQGRGFPTKPHVAVHAMVQVGNIPCAASLRMAGPEVQVLCVPQSKLLVSPLRAPVVILHRIVYRTPV